MKPKIPLILRYHRLMDAFTKSNDERDFYLDRQEGFLIYVDLDKPDEDLQAIDEELRVHQERFAAIPKMTFFEVKKFMEGFIQEKVYDIDTREKLLDILGSKDPRENFLEFIYDHLHELEKWQLYYQERSRIRIIEWLRMNQFQFVFEEDLDLHRLVLEKLKKTIFDVKVPKDLVSVREVLFAKAQTYYSNEALNPKPKRGRPPKQVEKVSIEPQFTMDFYQTVPPSAIHFLYSPEPSAVTFSEKFETERLLVATLRGSRSTQVDKKLEDLSERLEALRKLSAHFAVTVKEPLFKGKTFLAPSRLKISDAKPSENAPAMKGEKVESAVQEILPKKKRGRPRKEMGPVISSTKPFGIKKVSRIKGSYKSKK